MTKSNGIASLKQAAKLLNKHSPDGESLAYINPEEAKLLRAHGGTGIQTLSTVPSYIDWGNLAGKILPYGKKIFDFGTKAKDLYDQFKGTPQGPTPGQEQNPAWRTPPFNIEDRSPNINYDYNAAYLNQPLPSNLSHDMGASQFTGENPFLKNLGSSIMKSGKDFLTGRYGGGEGIKNIAKDAFSVWTALKAKKDQEGLNNAEMEQFNKLNQQMLEHTAEFQANIAGGGVTNQPEDITDVASYTDVTLPDMITTPTAAEGGRIGYRFGEGVESLSTDQMQGNGNMQVADLDAVKDGYSNLWFGKPVHELTPDQLEEFEILFKMEYGKKETAPQDIQTAAHGGRIGAFNGGIQGLMPQQGFMPQPGLDPRRGYANAGEVEESEFSIFSPKTWFSGGPESETNPTMIGTQDSLFNRANIGQLKDAINLYEMQIQNAEYLGELSEEAQADYELKKKQLEALEQGAQGNAYGGRIGAEKGGIMPLLNMGGMEKDYRQDGGFVPIGRKEKADDVPARLSKNEFVFTADAVRAAGGGDIDQGAQRMYNVMKNLEAGGEISEQSQGQG